MSEHLTLEQLDVDGAIRETAEQVDAGTRAAFLKKAGIGAGAILGSGAVMGALPSIASASAGVAKSDVAILNFALTLEYLEATFYAEAKTNNIGGTNGDLTAFVNQVSRHENTHVAFLRGALGRAAVKKPTFDFKTAVTDQMTFIKTAIVLEDTGVEAYLGQVGNIKSKKILAAAGSILPVEARHAAWIRDIASQTGRPGVNPSPAPAPFQGARTKAQVLAKVKATGFIVG